LNHPVKNFGNHRGRKKFLTSLNLFQFSTRGWPRTLDVTKPQEKRAASPPTNFKDKHEVKLLQTTIEDFLEEPFDNDVLDYLFLDSIQKIRFFHA